MVMTDAPIGFLGFKHKGFAPPPLELPDECPECKDKTQKMYNKLQGMYGDNWLYAIPFRIPKCKIHKEPRENK